MTAQVSVVFNDNRDCDFGIACWGEPGEPERIWFVLTVLRCTGLSRHVDPLYSCTVRLPDLDAVDHHRRDPGCSILAHGLVEHLRFETLELLEVSARHAV